MPKCLEKDCLTKKPLYNLPTEKNILSKRPTSLNSLPNKKRQKKQPNFTYI